MSTLLLRLVKGFVDICMIVGVMFFPVISVTHGCIDVFAHNSSVTADNVNVVERALSSSVGGELP